MGVVLREALGREPEPLRLSKRATQPSGRSIRCPLRKLSYSRAYWRSEYQSDATKVVLEPFSMET